MRTKATAAKLDAPPEIQGEALLEWERVTAELAAAGRLDSTARAILTIYCSTWDIHQQAMGGVTKFGAVVLHANNTAGPSPFYKIAAETGAQLKRLLKEMGLTPTSAKGKPAEADPDEDLTY